jgi:predicted metalloenzyme YecM
MENPLHPYFGDPAPFLQSILEGLAQNEVDVSGLEMDHICYRVADPARYLQLRKVLDQLGVLLSEITPSGREIATYALEMPILFKGKEIPLFELPAPRPDKVYPEGYEHVEFVVQELLDEFLSHYPGLSFDLSGMHKPVNPEVGLSFGNIAAKFHTRALRDVIRDEQNNR